MSVVIPCLKFSPNRIISYPSFELFNRTYKVSEKQLKNLESNIVKGDISKSSQAKIRQLITDWYCSIIFHMDKKRIPMKSLYKHLTFVTLTLSARQMHSDKFIKRHMLNEFLIIIGRKYKVKNYIWKSEVQSNGNLHFHILIDKPIWHWSLRDLWNDIQAKHGYIQEFYMKNLHVDPNSTDIHALDRVQNIVGYICKYMSKHEGKRPMEGRVVGYSDRVGKLASYRCHVDSEAKALLDTLEGMLEVDVWENEYCKVYRGNFKTQIRKVSPSLYKDLKRFYCEQYAYLNSASGQPQVQRPTAASPVGGSLMASEEKVSKQVDAAIQLPLFD